MQPRADSTLREARQRYFDRNGFGDDGGYPNRWVRLKAGPVSLYFANTKARVRAVKLHDLHHVLTGYETTWTGEAEIAAWEIASGCGRYYAAWFLNLGAFGLGTIIAPRAVYRAFMRGRCTANFYPGQFEESLLSKTVGEARHELLLDGAVAEPTGQDRLAFAGWAAAAVVFLIAPWACGAALISMGMRWLLS